MVAVENWVSQDGVFAQQSVWQRHFGFASQCCGFASEGFGQVSKVFGTRQFMEGNCQSGFAHFAHVDAFVEQTGVNVFGFNACFYQYGIEELVVYHAQAAGAANHIRKCSGNRMNAGGNAFHAFWAVVNSVHACQVGQQHL